MAVVLFPLTTSAQTPVMKDTSVVKNGPVVIAGKQYHKSNLHAIFWGRHYRQEWNTPVRANAFILDTAMGGLAIEKPLGGRELAGLLLEKKDGRKYVLRSIDKNYGNTLPGIFQHTFISDIAKDQGSAAYPFAAITITPMIAAAGILHTDPKIVLVPQQEKLGGLNKRYGNRLYLFDESSDNEQQVLFSTGSSKKVISTEKLYENVFADNDKKVDQKAFARARLFDMFIGDWDRHAGQWRWAVFGDDKKTVYEPIPVNRDAAYSQFDGFFPFVATHIAGATHLESFDDNIKKIGGFNKPGRKLDMQFLNDLSEADWVSVAISLQAALTDKVIDEGLSKLPPELYAISGKKIAAKLRSRRDHLLDFARRYYKYLARKIAVFGTSNKEYFEINRITDDETDINVYKIIKDSSKSKTLFYSRKIFKHETGVVYLYGLKAADVFTVKGNAKHGVKIRLIGITRIDAVSKHRDPKTKVYRGSGELYDSTFQEKVVVKPIVFVTPAIFNTFDDDNLQLFTRRGIHAGVQIAYHPAPWKKDSLETVHTVAVNYGFLRNIFTAEYIGFKPGLVGRWNGIAKARYDGPAADNYFGTGNESHYDSSDKYYNVFSRRIYAGIGLNRVINKTSFIEGLVFYQDIKVKNNSNSYIKEQEPLSPVFKTNQYAGVTLSYTYINVNNFILPTKGFHITAAIGYIKDLQPQGKDLIKTTASAAAYLPLSGVVSIASRVGGGLLNGTANYYHLNRLDGVTNLRGYVRERFYGNNVFYNNNEIRFIFNTHNYIFNGKIGALGFFDDGRIWQTGEASNKWHVGYGGGLIVSPFNKVVFTGTYTISAEGRLFQLGTEMYF